MHTASFISRIRPLGILLCWLAVCFSAWADTLVVSPIPSPRAQLSRSAIYLEEFLGGANSMSGGWAASNSGGSANTTPANASPTEFGLIKVSTGTTTSASQRGGFGTNNLAQIILGNGREVWFYAKFCPSDTLADAVTNTGWIVAGFGTVVASADSTCVEVRTTNGGNYTFVTGSGSNTTSTDTLLPATLSVFRGFSIWINDTNTRADLYLTTNGTHTLLASHTTNLPSAALGLRIITMRTAATAASLNATIDTLAYGYHLSSDRWPR